MSKLFDAVLDDDGKLIGLLLDRGASVSEGDSRGWTALHLACECGALEAATVLLDRGADPNALDRFGGTAMGRAVFATRGDKPDVLARKQQLVKLLRERGGDPLLGAAQFAREVGGPMAELFADLPVELPKHVYQQATVMTAGAIPAGPDGESWQKAHTRLWNLLVPPRGDAKTVQGEVIRCTGRLSDEAYRNGNINWGPMHLAMCAFLRETLAVGKLVDEIIERADSPDVSGAGSAYYRLSEAAVAYCRANPTLIER